MADADGVVNLPIRLSTLQDPRVFDYMPAPTSDWYPCPSPTQINWYTSSNCTAYVQAYYKCFRTYLYVSAAMAGQTVHIRADGHIDDVVNIIVNGANTGLYLPNFTQPDWRQVNITPYLTFGQVNEVLFRFADTAALHRGITQVSIRTGTGIIAAYDPTIGTHQVTITEITAEPDVLPAGGGTTECSVAATDSLGHALSYSWSASSTLGAGSFDDPTSPTPTWSSPANNTRADVTATLTVTVTCNEGQSAQASVGVVIPPAAPAVNLQISMRFDSGTENTVNAGTPYRYWISYGNSSSSTADALDVVVQDDLPGNTTYVARSAQAGVQGATVWFSADGENWALTELPADTVRYIRWTVRRLVPGASSLLSYQVRVTPQGNVTWPLEIRNRAKIKCSAIDWLSSNETLTIVQQGNRQALRLSVMYPDEQNRTVNLFPYIMRNSQGTLTARLPITTNRYMYREVLAFLQNDAVSCDYPRIAGVSVPWIVFPAWEGVWPTPDFTFHENGTVWLNLTRFTPTSLTMNGIDLIYAVMFGRRLPSTAIEAAWAAFARSSEGVVGLVGFETLENDIRALTEAVGRDDWAGFASAGVVFVIHFGQVLYDNYDTFRPLLQQLGITKDNLFLAISAGLWPWLRIPVVAEIGRQWAQTPLDEWVYVVAY